MTFRTDELSRGNRPFNQRRVETKPGKGIYKPGAVWTRRSDGEKFTLKYKDATSLVFNGVDGHFDEKAFIPPF